MRSRTSRFARGRGCVRDRRGRVALDGYTGCKADQSERDKLLNLADILHKRVIGQDEAVDAVSDSILRARSGLSDPNRPDWFVPVPRPHRCW